jgi:2-amino-4-hydroxy-6-hydroxymethyldihydropteridine diphosphokinase
MSRCCLGLGGNLGDVSRTFSRAVVELKDRAGAILAVSHVFRTVPVGTSAGAAYLNAAAVIETKLAPEPLLDCLQRIESQLGRTRDVRWGPRTIDLDLLLYEDVVLHDDRLDVPHPGCLYRRFVLDPLSEIAGDWRHPETGLTVGEMRSRLLRRPLPVAVAGGSQARRESLIEEIGRRLPDVRIVEWETPAENGGHGLIRWPCAPEAGGDQEAWNEDCPTCLVNLDATGQNDVSLLLSVVQALIDVPVLVGRIHGS